MIVRFSHVFSVVAIVLFSLSCDAKQLKSRLRVLSATLAANTVCFLDKHRSMVLADDILVTRRVGDVVVKRR